MSSTGLKENCFDYALFFNDISCLSDINCSGLSVYNSLINASSTSSTILGNLNSLSSYSYLNISSTNNNLNNLSSYSYLNISSTNNNLNNLSSYSYLNISSTNNNLNNLSSYSYLNISSTNNNLNNLSSQSYFLTNYTNLNSLNVSGISKLNGATTINSTLTISGTTILNNFTTINSPLYINTYQSTSTSALNINCTSVGVLVNIVQNLGWNDGVNYALNVSGYSMFGGIQINGQDTNNIYKRIGDLTIASPSLSSIILKTNYGNWEAMRLNSSGISVNTSFYVSGTAILNNQLTCLSTLNVSGTAILNNQLTCLSNLNVSGTVILNNATSCLSNLNVSGATTISNQITCLSSLNISGTATINNQISCLSSLNVSGTSNLGPLYINNSIGTQNTFLQIGTTGNILTIRGSVYTTLGCSEGTNDTHITLFSGAGAYYKVNYNTSGSTQQVFGDTTGNNYLTLQPNLNYCNNPFVIVGNTTINSNLNILGKVYASNLPNVSNFLISLNSTCTIGSSSYYKYDIDLTKYTTYITPTAFATTRKFKFMCALATGAHNSGLYSLNYDIDYSFINFTGVGNLSNYNGINALAYGSPYANYNLNQITPNGLFVWKNTFNYISVFAKQQYDLECVIIDYLA